MNTTMRMHPFQAGREKIRQILPLWWMRGCW
jgi:hypothetical protein